jgi:hypothetical protein
VRWVAGRSVGNSASKLTNTAVVSGWDRAGGPERRFEPMFGWYGGWVGLSPFSAQVGRSRR